MTEAEDYQNRIGEVSYTKHGTKATIVEYQNCKKVLVEFDDKYKYRYYTSYVNFKNGQLTNPYESRGKRHSGFVGVGKYNSKEHKVAYQKWVAIINRCKLVDYSNNKDLAINSYKDCSVCDDWLNFQNFAQWYYDNQYECSEELCIDKDILVHNNKLYSPNTCLLVPERINLLFVKEKGRRGTYPIGAIKHKNHFTSLISKEGKARYIGCYDTPLEAHLAYKSEKEKYIKKIADEYKDIIPKRVYEAMCNYKIEITD